VRKKKNRDRAKRRKERLQRRSDDNANRNALLKFPTPPIPTRVLVYGEVTIGRTFIGYARNKLTQLSRDMLFTNKKTGQKVVIDGDTVITLTINFGLSQITIYTKTDIPEEALLEMCACCMDCLMIGKITERILPENLYINVEICQGDLGRYVYVLFETVPFMDQNYTSVAGDMVLIMVRPAVTVTRYMDGFLQPETPRYYKYTEGYMWQVFNCLSQSDITTEGVDLTGNGIDTDAYTTSGTSCNKAGGSVATNEEDPPSTARLYIAALSFNMGECLSA